VRNDGVQLHHAIPVHTQTGYTPTNGATSATGSLTGTVVPGASISGSFTSALDNGTFALTASPVSYQPSSSTALIAGAYHHSYAASSKVYDVTQVIGTDGKGTGSDTANCTYSSTYTAADANHNAYSMTLTSTCPSQTQTTMALRRSFRPTPRRRSPQQRTQQRQSGNYHRVSNFTTDTLVSIVDSGSTAYLLIASK